MTILEQKTPQPEATLTRAGLVEEKLGPEVSGRVSIAMDNILEAICELFLQADEEGNVEVLLDQVREFANAAFKITTSPNGQPERLELILKGGAAFMEPGMGGPPELQQQQKSAAQALVDALTQRFNLK